MKKEPITSSKSAKTINIAVNMSQFQKDATYAVINIYANNRHVYDDVYQFHSESKNTVAMFNTKTLKLRVFDKSQYEFEKLV